MSPRPRLTSDEAILSAAGRAIVRVGPARVTLADVAREAGTSPATLLQRFGSKRGLLLALASSAADGSTREFAALREAHPSSPTAALLAMADCMSRMASTPAEISNGLAFLQLDLTDPDFHRLAIASGKVMHTEMRRLVSDAVKAGELSGVHIDPLARALQATLHGSMLGWAITREGTLRDWLRRDLETVLRPHRTRTSRQPRPSARRRRTQGRARKASHQS
jgi:AcrR family transcriptional regulator